MQDIENSADNPFGDMNTEKLDYSILEATMESFTTGSLTPIIKEELKWKIQTARLAAGKEELPKPVFKEPETLELTPEEEAKRTRRREKNRIAALKCRNKKKEHRKSLDTVREELEQLNNELKTKVTELEQQKSQLLQHLKETNVNLDYLRDVNCIHDNQSHIHDNQPHVHDNQSYVRVNQSHEHDNQSYVHDNQSYVHVNQSHEHDSQSYVYGNQSHVHDHQPCVHENLSHVHENLSHVHDNLSHVHGNLSYVEMTDFKDEPHDALSPEPTGSGVKDKFHHTQDIACLHTAELWGHEDELAKSEDQAPKHFANADLPDCHLFLPVPMEEEAMVPGSSNTGMMGATSPSLFGDYW